MPDRIRHTFRKCEQDVVLDLIGYVRIFELAARPIMDLLQFVQCTRYEKMLHYDMSLCTARVLYGREIVHQF